MGEDVANVSVGRKKDSRSCPEKVGPGAGLGIDFRKKKKEEKGQECALKHHFKSQKGGGGGRTY